MDRELAKTVLEIAVFLTVFAICFLGVPVMISILLCQALGISHTDPRAAAVTIAVTVLWFFAYAYYLKIDLETWIDRCKACCLRGLHEIEKCMKYEDEDEVS